MIQSKKDLNFYLEEDMKRNLHYDKMTFKRWLLHKIHIYMKVNSDIAFHYLVSLRKLEYAENCLKEKHVFGKIVYYLRLIKFSRLSFLYDIVIHTNTVGYGLYLPHLVGGGIIINCKNMGNYCTVNCGVLVGNKHTRQEIPTIGNYVDLTTGSKIIGRISIGDNVMVAPNSVVVKSVPSNSIVSGIPAQILKMK